MSVEGETRTPPRVSHPDLDMRVFSYSFFNMYREGGREG